MASIFIAVLAIRLLIITWRRPSAPWADLVVSHDTGEFAAQDINAFDPLDQVELRIRFGSPTRRSTSWPSSSRIGGALAVLLLGPRTVPLRPLAA